MKMAKMGQGVLVQWNPSRDSGVALLTELGMILSYIVIGWSGDNLQAMMIFVAFVIPLLTVGVPVYWMMFVKRQGLSSLGLTLRNWLPALLLGVVLSIIEVLQFATAGTLNMLSDRWMPQAVAGAVSLWEPLFVFGWLQLRFEKDFGVLPAILMASACFALYHIGFGSANMMIGQFLSAVVYATVFRLVSNLLVVWPLLWAASSARICIGGYFCFFNWGSASFMVIIFVVEVAFIVFTAYWRRHVKSACDRDPQARLE